MSPARMEKVEAASRMALDWVEALNRRDPVAVAALFCEDGVWEAEGPAPDGTVFRNLSGVLDAAAAWMPADATSRIVVEEVMGLGFRCQLRFRRMGVRGLAVLQLRGGKIAHLAVFTKH